MTPDQIITSLRAPRAFALMCADLLEEAGIEHVNVLDCARNHFKEEVPLVSLRSLRWWNDFGPRYRAATGKWSEDDALHNALIGALYEHWCRQQDLSDGGPPMFQVGWLDGTPYVQRLCPLGKNIVWSLSYNTTMGWSLDHPKFGMTRVLPESNSKQTSLVELWGLIQYVDWKEREAQGIYPWKGCRLG